MDARRMIVLYVGLGLESFKVIVLNGVFMSADYD
jgi:hypothetical protein